MLVTLLLWLAALGPAYVMSWKGCWALMDLLLLPNDRWLSAVVSLAIGVAVGFPLVFMHRPLTEASAGRRLVLALHHFVGLEVQVLLWRGGWILADLVLGVRSLGGPLAGLVTAAVMAGTGCLPTAGTAPPVPHRRGAEPAAAEAPPAARALLTLLPVLAACVLVWHGAWDALDSWLPPSAPLWQTASLLGGSAAALAALLTLPHGLGWVASADAAEERPHRLLRRLREDLLAAAVTVAVVGYWKALFDLAARLAVPGYPGLSDATLMVTGFVVVVLADHSAQTYAVGRVTWSTGDLRWLQPLADEPDEGGQPLLTGDAMP
ncbi:uncharacterized protein LOC122380201 [Amphibalanus amphitrite]|uniref:uncharacterized protein LOC122380200 n=1 Tax=Amphibalanus amphitrite TaxID=1232801 RepID=UPI001C91BF49|nr:uncharacterized protein LOC122380200 [Amphibalanus amphitrite]XP_043219099.1 uncharacterized protein LOC122380201 [Amphibalanus amphitrite]